MSVKLYVQNNKEQDALVNIISIIKSVIDTACGNDDMTKGEYNEVESFLNNVEIVVGAAELDTALMSEIGKAYKGEYLKAKEAGDTEKENKMLGSMYAVKQIMDMVKEPTI